THRIELLAGLVGVVGLAGGDQLLGHFLVTGHARGLVDRAFVVVQAQPLHRFEDRVDRALGAALAVGVFDTQHELAATVACLQPAVQRGAGATNVQVAGGTGGETGADGHVESTGWQICGDFTPPDFYLPDRSAAPTAAASSPGKANGHSRGRGECIKGTRARFAYPMEWTPPTDPASKCQTGGVDQPVPQQEESVMQINRVALDLAKQVIQMHAVDRSSKVLVRKPLRRAQLLPF